MSKTYFGRCAAVGIAGLTAMSSIAIVASAATQASLVYELKYKGISEVIMKTSVAYATDSTQYCQRGTSGVAMDDGFNVTFANLAALTAEYQKANVGANNSIYYTTATTATVWAMADFTGTGISAGMSAAGWEYKAPKAADPTTPAVLAVEEVYNKRSVGTDNIISFKTESERTAAKNAMITTAKSAYTALATPAATQFRNDINAAAANAKKRLLDVKDGAISTAKTTYEASVKDAAATAVYNEAVNTATNIYNASVNAVSTSASKIISEFTQTFNANNFNFDFAFETNNAPIIYSSTVGGISVVTDASYKSFGTTETDLADSRYWNGSSIRNDADTYVFKGEIQPKEVFDGTKAFVFIGSAINWVNFEVIDNGSTTGGNTTPSGGSTSGSGSGSTGTTTTTTWYPDSAAYRAASEVSYRGENGYWYTSASAASTYGGGYTGTSKNSNFSSVSSANSGKTIYFDASTGTYTTGSTSYSYVVKEGTSSSSSTTDDPYYTYFFGNKNNTTTTTTTVPAGSPAISGASKYAGWTNISAYITNRGKSGATYTINMNEGTVVPSAVLAAAKAKNVTLVFSNKNGSKVTVKPGKVSTGSDLNVAVTYNVNDVKKSLVNKAKKVNAGTVSTSQIRVGSEGAIGGTETVTVKFSTKRAGCTVKAYRLTASGSLKKEATGTVASTGRVNLNLTKGGSYLLVVID